MTRIIIENDGRLALASGGAPPAWVERRYQAFRDLMRLTTRPFPCHFASMAEMQGQLRYSYLGRAESERPTELVEAALDFAGFSRRLDAPTALIVFVEVEPGINISECEQRFWQILQALHDLDPIPWPPEIPVTPDSAAWAYCFGGEAWFVNGHSAYHLKRRSRHCSEGLLIVMQTRRVLEKFVGRGARAGRIRERIRSRLREYDSISISPHLGVYPSADSREWMQYWLGDSNTPLTGACPLNIRPSKE